MSSRSHKEKSIGRGEMLLLLERLNEQMLRDLSGDRPPAKSPERCPAAHNRALLDGKRD